MLVGEISSRKTEVFLFFSILNTSCSLCISSTESFTKSNSYNDPEYKIYQVKILSYHQILRVQSSLHINATNLGPFEKIQLYSSYGLLNNPNTSFYFKLRFRITRITLTHKFGIRHSCIFLHRYNYINVISFKIITCC